MSSYDFSTQAELFTIAKAILEDYQITSWSIGGGTALSYLYYQHRMSYDIDIFLEEYPDIQKLIGYQKEIARNLGIPFIQIESSSSAITFILETDGYGLKLDFVYSPTLTSNPFNTKEVFGFTGIKVQTPLEIIAKKLKHREKATIRDFVDYAYAQKHDSLLTSLKSENIVDIDRYFDVIDKFNTFDKDVFNEELKGLMPNQKTVKDDFTSSINDIMTPKEMIKVALDHTGEVVAFDEFIETYRLIYEELGTYEIYTIQNKNMDYKKILSLNKSEILKLQI